jgi:hypothetical protein
MKTYEVTVDFIGTRTYTVQAKDETEALDVAQQLGKDDAGKGNMPELFVEAVYGEETGGYK